MAEVALQLGAKLDVLNRHELADALHESGGWEREAAFGLRAVDLPIMSGTVSGSAITLGADQPGQRACGPPSGFYWAVHSITVDGLAAADTVRVYKMTKFRGIVSGATGLLTFSKGALTLKSGDYLRVLGTGLSATGTITVSGEAVSVPGPLMWKLLA